MTNAGDLEQGQPHGTKGRQMKVLLCALGMLSCVISVNAKADAIQACPVPTGWVSVPIPEGMPESLRANIETNGPIAKPNEGFDATDIVSTHVLRRYIFVWQRANQWLVATEHGGRGYNDPIYVYERASDGQSVRLMDTEIQFPETICSGATNLAHARENPVHVMTLEAVALFRIGYMYERGNGVAQDYEEAMKYYQLAAAQGNDVAIFRIGYLYEKGFGVPRDYASALEWYKKAAGLGNAPAMTGIDRINHNLPQK
jgi:hypothetical protein